MANQTGKRYVCSNCGTEMLVTRGGNGTLECCDRPMALKGSAGAAATAPTASAPSPKQES